MTGPHAKPGVSTSIYMEADLPKHFNKDRSLSCLIELSDAGNERNSEDEIYTLSTFKK